MTIPPGTLCSKRQRGGPYAEWSADAEGGQFERSGFRHTQDRPLHSLDGFELQAGTPHWLNGAHHASHAHAFCASYAVVHIVKRSNNTVSQAVGTPMHLHDCTRDRKGSSPDLSEASAGSVSCHPTTTSLSTATEIASNFAPASASFISLVPCRFGLGIATLRVPGLLFPGSPVATNIFPSRQDIARPASQDRRFLDHWQITSFAPQHRAAQHDSPDPPAPPRCSDDFVVVCDAS
ncbi:hypothetical protein LA080_016405 [Diaporthe eres]|nr:hypothetical protein LA080_016405 [Diaporthe eres]